MLTGTPLDLTPFGALLSGLGFLYWVAALGIALAAAWWLKRAWLRILVPLAIVAAFAFPVVTHINERQAQQAAAKAKFDAAQAHFEMRCRSAGEKIHRTVESIDGIVWMKWRDKYDVHDDYDQFKLSDPFGRDCNAEGCIEQLLRLDAEAGRFQSEVAQRKSRFKYVESMDPTDGELYRYTGTMKLPSPPWTPEVIERQQQLDGRAIGDDSYRFALERKRIAKGTARYGVTWDDISTREDREHWIAGGSIKVVDMQTSEVIAERVGYMMDPGQGSRNGFRTPWLFAQQKACPPFAPIGASDSRRMRGAENLRFVQRVLHPTKSEKL